MHVDLLLRTSKYGRHQSCRHYRNRYQSFGPAGAQRFDWLKNRADGRTAESRRSPASPYEIPSAAAGQWLRKRTCFTGTMVAVKHFVRRGIIYGGWMVAAEPFFSGTMFATEQLLRRVIF